MKQFFLAALICCITSVAWSQNTIQGRVIDKTSKEPLELAYVRYSNTTSGVITNKQGYFSLEKPAGNASIIISFIGFTTQEIKATSHNAITVEMEKGPVNLQEVVITPQSAAASFHTISKIDLNLQPVRSAQDILRTVPGLFIGQHQGGGKAEQIFLRGFDIDHGTDINVTVDGLPVNMVSHAHGQGYADLHFLIPELTGNVDYGKGPYYTQFGNLGTAGYVSMNTVNSLDKSTVKLEGGQFNTLRGLAMVDLLSDRQKQKGTNAYIASEFLYSDGPFESPQHFNRFNLFGKLNTNIGKNNKLTLTGSTLSSDWDASGQIPERAVKSGMIGRFGYIDNTEGGYTSRSNASAKLTSYLSTTTTWENQAYFTDYHFNLHSNFTLFLNDPVNGDQIRQREARNIYGYQSKLSNERKLGAWDLQSIYGAGFRLDQTRNTELSHTINRNTVLEYKQLGDIRETNGFAYADESIEKNRWRFNLGTRLDYFNFHYHDKLSPWQSPDQQKVIVSPKLNIQYTLNTKSQLYLKTGKGFHSNDARVVVFNRGYDILPAAYGADLGVLLKPTRNLLVNVAAWYLYLQQEFVYVGDEGVVEPSGKTRRIGIDVSARYQFNTWLFADVNVNQAKPRSAEAAKGENYIPLAPTLTSTGGLSWQLKSGWNGSLRYRHMHDRAANEDNSVIAKGYTVTDLAINYTKKKYELGIAIENLFNVKWNETQFDTESRLKNEPAPVTEIHFTPGTPFFTRMKLAVYF
ncbi:TonB-dependent receptor [Niastella koreensis]|uniref:TonB-dependent receptor n=2 Tax=Niastella koreensis TaxID=354356 RepID=G8TFH0_NIAKG|nr:TonB-dependent receptor [Niastella koreensis]AEV98401.1 TonB-dependent receptor [Niastella koreensis GR20-10]OQP53149.1 TonB-dependent receptor [Niastella koreensis]